MQHQLNTPGRARSLESLLELVAALDRRVLQFGRAAGQEITQEASELRAEASLRITELRIAARDAQEGDLARSTAVMTDDGGPAPKE